jgi:site-specific DNA-methyltransferase (adenine-specific)
MEQRQLSKISKKDYSAWFRQIWNIPGASTRSHPAPFPFELANRLVRMFSFWGDTVLDPFCGTGTTMLASMKANRNSIGTEVDPEYCKMAFTRLERKGRTFFNQAEVKFEKCDGLLVGKRL